MGLSAEPSDSLERRAPDAVAPAVKASETLETLQLHRREAGATGNGSA